MRPVQETPDPFDRKFRGGSCRAGKFALITWATINPVMAIYHEREKGRALKDTGLKG